MNVRTWSSQSGRFSSATVRAVPVWRTQATRLRTRRRKVRTSERWILLLAGIALVLAGYTTVQTMMFTLELDSKAGTASTTGMMLVSSESLTTSPPIAPIAAQPPDRPTGRTGSAHEVSPPQTVMPAHGSTTVGSSSLYDLAAARYGLDSRMLRALHHVESTASSGGCTANRQGSGALGPFQFKPATFRQYAVDADGNGHTDICGFADSLFSAAHYLKALGADSRPDSDRTYRALLRYGTPADQVVTRTAREPR